MSTEPQHPITTTCRYEDMRLQTGDRLQIELPVDGSRAHYFTSLIGHVDGQSVLARTPIVQGAPIAVREGSPALLRAFSGKYAYAFETTVLKVCRTPFAYLHLAYPAAVRATAVRGAARVQVELPATAVNRRDPRGIPVGCTIVDLSVGGAQVECQRSLGGAGETVQMFFKFRLEPNGYDVKMSPEAEIQTVRRQRDDSSGEDVYSHGVRFGDMHATEALLLQSYIQQVLLADRGRIV